MSLTIGGATSAPAAASNTHPKAAMLKDMRSLGQALATGDLDAAKASYTSIVRNAPAGAQWNPDSAFAEMGRAIKSGDANAAKAAFDTMVANAREQYVPPQRPVPAPPQQPVPQPPVPSSTGGSAGSLLNVAA